MPLSYRAFPDHVRVEIVGEHTVAEVESLVRALASDPAVLGVPYLVVDLERAVPRFRTEEQEGVVALHGPLLRHGLRAVLIHGSRPHVFGMARGYAIQAEAAALPVHVFRTEGEAREWLAREGAGATPPRRPPG